MKMTLDQLKVDSYATQVSENELTEIKGGTAWFCDFVYWLVTDQDEEYEQFHGHDEEDAGEAPCTTCNILKMQE